MDDAESLRERAMRLLALAIAALEEGHGEYSNRFTELASEALSHAEEMERATGLRSNTVSDPSVDHVAPQMEGFEVTMRRF